MNIENNSIITVISGDSVFVPFRCFNKQGAPLALNPATTYIAITVRDENMDTVIKKDTVSGVIIDPDQVGNAGKFKMSITKRDTYNREGTFDFDVEFIFINNTNKRGKVTGIIGKFVFIKDYSNAR